MCFQQLRRGARNIWWCSYCNIKYQGAPYTPYVLGPSTRWHDQTRRSPAHPLRSARAPQRCGQHATPVRLKARPGMRAHSLRAPLTPACPTLGRVAQLDSKVKEQQRSSHRSPCRQLGRHQLAPLGSPRSEANQACSLRLLAIKRGRVGSTRSLNSLAHT